MDKKLIYDFIFDNFDVDNFNVVDDNDYFVHLIDDNHDVLTVGNFLPNRIFTLINNKRHLIFELSFNSKGQRRWVILADERCINEK